TAKWFQVVYTYDANSSIYRLFLNGVKVMQDTSTYNDALMGGITIPTTATDFFIGKNPNTVQTWLGNYLGDMDDFRLYNVALTEDQVGALYNGENGAEGN
ncbi:MAG TPA: LamG-like jellyroll fold domain-containing protein, partial [Williamwhitmania sp.]|nr:LamG-like jellyroll fold domain-containing protein [Williamwhitmania sp.]